MKILMILIILGSFISIGGAVLNQNSSTGNDIQENNIATIDNPSINQLDAVKRANDHTQSIVDRIGKKDIPLANKIKSVPNQNLRVAIWLNSNGIVNVQKSDIDANNALQLEQNKKAFAVKVAASISSKNLQLKDFLKLKNITILYQSRYAPVLFAELNSTDIQDIENRPDVVFIQLETQYQEAISNSVPSVMAPAVWPYNNGGGVKVAVVEDDGVAFANPYLKPGLYFNQTNTKVYYHATGIAGIIGSMNQTYRGVAYNGPAILSANSQTLSDSDLMSATEWAMDNGASVLSNSWVLNTGGSWTPMTSYYDYIISNYPWPTVVFSAGNCGQCGYPSRIVGAPALGYNVIAVGSYDDAGTGWQWSDDVMSLFSSYGGPPSPHNDRTKPEVVAVGNHSTTANGLTSTITTSPWIGAIGKGTSYSSPEVSGEASLLMNISPALIIRPEAVKAIIVASADHNIEGNSRLSSKDGAGGINVLEAYNIVKNNRWNGTILSYNSGSNWFGPSFNANIGQKVRIAISWDSSSTGYGGSDTLNADLDLYVQRLSGSTWVTENRAGSSNSWDNNYEIVEFNAPVSGTYRAMVTKYRWDNVSFGENFGYALYIK